MGGTTASQSAERSLALIAGREAWNDESPSRSAITKVAGVLEAAAFLTAAILSWTYHLAARSRPSSSVIVFAPVPRVRTPVPVLVNIPAPERGALMVSPPELNWWITKSVAAVSAPVPLIS